LRRSLVVCADVL